MGFKDGLQLLAPVSMSYTEPLTTLQRLGEIMEYTELLESANLCPDSAKRLALVTAFVIAPYAAHQRPFKPLPSFLGETCSLHCGNGVLFMAEQVSVEPSTAAAYAENDHFTYDIVAASKMPNLKGGLGRCHIKLKKTKEVFSVLPVTTKMHHTVLAGHVDHFGDLVVTNNTTREKAVVKFEQCKSFGRSKGHIKGMISMGRPVDDVPIYIAVLTGQWNSHVDFQTKDPATGCRGELQRLWTCSPKPQSDPWQRSRFAIHFSTTDYGLELLKSDGRRRPDLIALISGANRLAMRELQKLKKQERKEAHIRSQNHEVFTSLYFEKIEGGVIYTGDHHASVVPFYRWAGSFPQVAKKSDEANRVLGIGFSPGAYATIERKQ